MKIQVGLVTSLDTSFEFCFKTKHMFKNFVKILNLKAIYRITYNFPLAIHSDDAILTLRHNQC